MFAVFTCTRIYSIDLQMRAVTTHFNWTQVVTRCTKTRMCPGSQQSTDVCLTMVV